MLQLRIVGHLEQLLRSLGLLERDQAPGAFF